jgi:hypothetical protein
MISELQRLILTSAAMVLFLAAAQNAGGLKWRASLPPVVVATAR